MAPANIQNDPLPQSDSASNVCAINRNMPFCPSCRAEFREGFTRCNECDMPLVAELKEPATRPEAIDGARRGELRVVSTSSDGAEADLNRGILDSAGIPSISEEIRGADSSLFPGVHSGSVPYRLLVCEEDYLAAKEILDQSRAPLAVGQIEEQLTLFRNRLIAIA